MDDIGVSNDTLRCFFTDIAEQASSLSLHIDLVDLHLSVTDLAIVKCSIELMDHKIV